GSAALQMATPGALQPQIRDIVSQGGLVAGGIIPFRHTIFLWQSLVSVIVEIIVVTTVMWLATPPPHRARTARAMGIELTPARATTDNVQLTALSPGQRLEHSRALTWLVVALGGAYLVRYFAAAADPLNAITLNVLNLAFLLAGFAMHGTPARFMRAVQHATPAVWGIILQFP